MVKMQPLAASFVRAVSLNDICENFNSVLPVFLESLQWGLGQQTLLLHCSLKLATAGLWLSQTMTSSPDVYGIVQ